MKSPVGIRARHIGCKVTLPLKRFARRSIPAETFVSYDGNGFDDLLTILIIIVYAVFCGIVPLLFLLVFLFNMPATPLTRSPSKKAITAQYDNNKAVLMTRFSHRWSVLNNLLSNNRPIVRTKLPKADFRS